MKTKRTFLFFALKYLRLLAVRLSGGQTRPPLQQPEMELDDGGEFEWPTYIRRHLGRLSTRVYGRRQRAGIPPEILYPAVVAFVRAQDKASISIIQREFRIGFNLCAQFIEQMEKEGIIGPAEGCKPRKILGSTERCTKP